jgi:alkylation response protein AidB-like acyl-CoA dehydrogenase
MSGELEEFRAEVRAFLDSALPPALAARVRAGHTLSRDELMGWHRALHRRGWVALHWPVAQGGTGWDIARKYVFEEECARAGAPSLIPMGLTIIGPLLIAFGSPAQQARFLPRILDGSEIWCQGWSEPEAGSDLAALRCRAVREGEEYVVTGTKIWTTHAQWADWCMLLARTSSAGRRQEGITILLVDMRLPGVSIRALPSLDGMHVLNQVTFEGVRVPVALRVGEEGRGWGLLKATVGHERILNADVGRTRALLDRLLDLLRRQGAVRPGLRQRVARAAVRLQALESLVARAIASPDPANGPDAPLIKVRGTELQQELSWLLSEAAGRYGLPHHREVLTEGWQEEPVGPPDLATLTPFYLFWRKASISAGTNEIMRNLIARRLLDGAGDAG